jgi:hypothetical protein
MAMPMRELWRSCEEIAAKLPVPKPFDFEAFVRTIGSRRGRRIELIPVEAQPGNPCGLLVSTDRCDYIFYAANTTPLHQLHIQCHELAHLLRGHGGTSALDTEAAALLMPSLPASLIERVLGRTAYSTENEQDAELLASLIMRRIGHVRPQRIPRSDVVEPLAQLTGVFDHQPHQHG